LARGDLASDQKKAEDEQRTLIFVDESAFYLLPAMVSTYAPVGETPIIRAPCSYDHLSVISGITPAGKLLLQVHEHAIRGEQVVDFLEHLLRHQTGKLLVIWDGASIHRCQAIKQFLADGGAERIWLERLPAYAPDLNPDEGIWHYLKYVELRNVVCANLEELRYELRLAIARVRHKLDVIPGCMAQAGLSL
jgi:transposase